MIQKYKFVEANLEMLRKLTRNGYVSPKLLQYYNLYLNYMSIKNGQKINRYEIVSKETKQSVRTVRRAVSEMKSYISN